LQRAHWVVLSACDTGLGEVVADEGVFGLRRGFRLAGAHTVLMSLWRVDDAATAELMQSLYAARWQAHADTPQALASAELATLAARRERGESTHPYYWAAFVASGDWR
jgi:CHAT domain-containing protein